MATRSSSFSLRTLAMKGLWLSLGLIFLGIGLQMLTAYEAAAIRPFTATSPFLSWAYRLLGTRGASALFAVGEIPIGLGLLSALFRPGDWPARAGAAGAAAVSFVSASFLLTAPGVVISSRGLPLLSQDVGQLFVKDLVLLAASLLLLAEAT